MPRFNKFGIFRILLSIVVIVVSFGSVAAFGSHSHLTQAAANALPFDLPTQAALKASPKKVFAVYTPVFPISLDNLDSGVDYYTEQYLNPNGENSNYAPEGAILRERPLPRAVDPSPEWALNDMKTEVGRATSAGIDGFNYDMLATDGVVWNRLVLLLRAAPLV